MKYNDDYDDEDYDDDEDEDEDEEDEEQIRLFKIEEKILDRKLTDLFAKIAKSGQVKLSQSEKKDMKKAERHPDLETNINMVNGVLAINRAKAAYKVMASSPALWYVLVFVFIIFLVIAAIAAIASLMPWLFPDDENNDGTVNASCGITGTDFYGARMVYTDNDKARQSIVEDYVEFVENGILEVQQITSVTAENGGNSFDVELTVNIVTPDSNYDYTQFDEVEFRNNYIDLYTVVYDIAKVVYKIDNGEDFSGVSLTQCVDEIKYFGYGNVDEVRMVVANAISNKTAFTSSNDTENVLTQNDITLAINNRLLSYYSSYSTARTEKLFVKDYILEGEEMMKDIQKENYIAMIFMPRKNVTFAKLSFIVGNADLTNFKMDVNGETITSNGENLGDDEKQSYLFDKIEIISVQKFTDIDESNLGALSEEMSLYDIANLANSSIYLTQATSEGENPTTYFTIKKEGLVVNLKNDEAFNIVEFETIWSAG